MYVYSTTLQKSIGEEVDEAHLISRQLISNGGSVDSPPNLWRLQISL